MKRLIPFLIAGIITEGALLLIERLQSPTGRGDGFGPGFFFLILAGIFHAPSYGLVLLLRVPESYHRWVLPPIQALFLAIVFWLFFRFLIEPYRAKGPSFQGDPK
jgi:hypothetical protein